MLIVGFICSMVFVILLLELVSEIVIFWFLVILSIFFLVRFVFSFSVLLWIRVNSGWFVLLVIVLILVVWVEMMLLIGVFILVCDSLRLILVICVLMIFMLVVLVLIDCFVEFSDVVVEVVVV